VPQPLLLGEPGVPDGRGHGVGIQGFAQDLQPPVELAAEDAVAGVGLVDGPAPIGHRAPQDLGRVLVFEALDAVARRPAEDEADHHVVEAAVDEVVHDGPQGRFATNVVEPGHREDYNAPHVIFRRKAPAGPPEGAPARLAAVVDAHLPDADAITRRTVTAVAGLLACVAYADRDYTEAEERGVRGELQRIHYLSPAGVDAICAVLAEDIVDLAQAGDQAWTRELRELGERELRVETLDALIEIAASDHKLSLNETNYLRRLTTSLGLTQADYDGLQARHRDKLTVLGG
jgi:uncharacterized tellurite resistance protein B-like protein